jgi:NADPH-dependent 2,4-dienoyl-CoA reductase/sulfur reductase-like enzyme
MIARGHPGPRVERLVVIGGDAAGMSAASEARRRRGPDDLEIVAFERGRYTSYSACGIPYLVGEVVPDPAALIARSPEEHRRRGIEVHIRHEVTAIDTEERSITVADLESCTERREPYDHLVVATGAVPIRPDLPGAEAEGIFGVQVLEDGLALGRLLDSVDAPRRAVVIGAGYIGLEMAEAMVQRGLEVALVDQASQPMGTLDPDMGALVADGLRAIGVNLHLGAAVEGYETSGRAGGKTSGRAGGKTSGRAGGKTSGRAGGKTSARAGGKGGAGRVCGVVTSDATLPADLVVLGLGVRPNIALAQAAGVAVGPSGGLAVDQQMQTRTDRVWAAGDCVEVHHRVSRQPTTIALGTHANKQGRVAGVNLGGGYATFPGVVGTAVTKVCGLEVARTGLRESEAEAAGFAFESVVVGSTTRAGYFPGAAPITTKLVAERRSGRLLGAQIVGAEGAAKRIDVLACALWNEMAVDEIAHLDLGYAPPFSPVWDPVLIAARKAAARVGGGWGRGPQPHRDEPPGERP